jgi:hypothetical protein
MVFGAHWNTDLTKEVHCPHISGTSTSTKGLS